MQDTRNIEGGIRDENTLARSGCNHLINWWDAVSFDIVGRLQDLNDK